MQNYTIRFVETLKARLEATGCSIATALDVELKALDGRTLLKLRDAGLDLARIVELEMMARTPDCDCAEKGWRPNKFHNGHAPTCQHSGQQAGTAQESAS